MAFEPLSIVSGIIGLVAGAAISHFRDRLKLKSDTTFKLHEEFSTESMFKNRALADEVLSRNRGKSFRDLYKDLPVGGLDAVWAVTSFYEKLYVAVRHKRVDESIIPELFGEIFVWWYINFLEAGLAGHEWESKHRIDALNKWLQSNVSMTVYCKWVKSARDFGPGRPPNPSL